MGTRQARLFFLILSWGTLWQSIALANRPQATVPNHGDTGFVPLPSGSGRARLDGGTRLYSDPATVSSNRSSNAERQQLARFISSHCSDLTLTAAETLGGAYLAGAGGSLPPDRDAVGQKHWQEALRVAGSFLVKPNYPAVGMELHHCVEGVLNRRAAQSSIEQNARGAPSQEATIVYDWLRYGVVGGPRPTGPHSAEINAGWTAYRKRDVW